VVVLAPIGQAPRRSLGVAEQASALSKQARLLVVTPDRAARAAIGRNPLDPRRPGPGGTGRLAQGAALAADARKVWSG